MASASNTVEISSSSNSLTDIEGELEKVNARRGWDLVVSPSTLGKRRGAFHDAALLQVFLTWSRVSPDAKLKIQSRNPAATTEQVLAEACDYSVGIGTLSMAASIVVDGRDVSRHVALLPAAQRVEHAYLGNFDRLARGRCVDLLSVSGAKAQFLRPLFSNKAESVAVKDKFELKATLRGMALQAHPKATGLLNDSTVAALANFTHELFENTQDHATTDIRNQPYRRHIEGMFASWTVLSDELAQQDFFTNASLRDYWATIAASQAVDRDTVGGICFSFIDSGPGMAARYLGKDLSQITPEQERASLEDCLKLRATSKGHGGAGIGLTEVLVELAELHGLLRVRSGRLSIFKAFTPGLPEAHLHAGFRDWDESRPLLQATAGTLVSIFIPLPRV